MKKVKQNPNQGLSKSRTLATIQWQRVDLCKSRLNEYVMIIPIKAA